jgi:hypothetical protein
MTIMGDLGGILATWLLGVLSLAPCQYFLASEVTVVLLVLMLVLFISNTIYLCDQNRKKSKIRRTKSPNEQKADLGDQSVKY